jgi:hypothetical protein
MSMTNSPVLPGRSADQLAYYDSNADSEKFAVYLGVFRPMNELEDTNVG